MKFVLFLISISAFAGVNPCSSIQIGSSVYGPNGQGYISWGGFIPGAANSSLRQDISSAPVHAKSSVWMTSILGGGGGVMMLDPMHTTDGFHQPWPGRTVHYIHGDTFPRTVIGGISKDGNNGVSDPGTFPNIFSPRISAQWGPYSRPSGYNLSFPENIADNTITVVDVDNCFGYEFWGCKDAGSGILCAAGGSFYLPGGDNQRPWNIPSLSNILNVGGVPHFFGRLGWDEYNAALLGTPIDHALVVTFYGSLQSGSWTGPAAMNQFNGGAFDANFPPLGARVRLIPGFDITSVPFVCRPLLVAAKKYGFVFVDGGSAPNMTMQEEGDLWPRECVPAALPNIFFTPGNFEVVVPPQNPGIYCAYSSDPGCGTLPTGSVPSIPAGGFKINGATSATVTLSSTIQTLTITWPAITGVVDLQGNDIPTRYISWGTDNKYGPGPVNSFLETSVSVTVCNEDNAQKKGCDFMQTGTFPIQLMVQNRFGRSTQSVNLIVN